MIQPRTNTAAKNQSGARFDTAVPLYSTIHVGEFHDRVTDVDKGKPEWSSFDDLWVERIRKGDEDAFGAMFRAFYKDLCRFVHQYIRSPEIAEENVQEIFLGIWQRRERWDPSGPVKPYLYRAARNRALNVLRNRRAENRGREDLSNHQPRQEPTPEEVFRRDELSVEIQRSIDKLPGRCREIFLLSRRSGLRHAEIASLLNLSVKTVETQIGRALRTLRAAVARASDEGS